jgi:hypothetical protein
MPIRSCFVPALCLVILTHLAAAEELPIERVFSPPALVGPAPAACSCLPTAHSSHT